MSLWSVSLILHCDINFKAANIKKKKKNNPSDTPWTSFERESLCASKTEYPSKRRLGSISARRSFPLDSVDFGYLSNCGWARCLPAATLILTTKTLFNGKASPSLAAVISSNTPPVSLLELCSVAVEWLTGQAGRGAGGEKAYPIR